MAIASHEPDGLAGRLGFDAVKQSDLPSFAESEGKIEKIRSKTILGTARGVYRIVSHDHVYVVIAILY
jgi:hypothetical protein